MTGPNFQAAQTAPIQKATDTASRTNPRSSPMTVEPNKTNKIKTSAPVIRTFYRTATPLAVKPTITTRKIPFSRRDHAARMAVLRKFEPQALRSGAIRHGPDSHLEALFGALAAG